MEWISINEKIPPKDVSVLCFYYDQYIQVMEYWYDDENGNKIFFNPPSPSIDNVTHWMPLPQPPKDE